MVLYPAQPNIKLEFTGTLGPSFSTVDLEWLVELVGSRIHNKIFFGFSPPSIASLKKKDN